MDVLNPATCIFLWENTVVLDWWCFGFIYTFYSGRPAIATGSDKKQFRLVFHRLLYHFHFQDKMAIFLSSLHVLPSIFYYAAPLPVSYSKQRGQALSSSSHNVNLETFESATVYGFVTRQDTSRQGVRSLNLVQKVDVLFL
jgi:hypothetical protein